MLLIEAQDEVGQFDASSQRKEGMLFTHADGYG